MKTVARFLVFLMIALDAGPAFAGNLGGGQNMDPPVEPINAQDVSGLTESQLRFKECSAFAQINNNACDLTYAAIKKRIAEFELRSNAVQSGEARTTANCDGAQKTSSDCGKNANTLAAEGYEGIAGAEEQAAKNLRDKNLEKIYKNTPVTDDKGRIIFQGPSAKDILKTQLAGNQAAENYFKQASNSRSPETDRNKRRDFRTCVNSISSSGSPNSAAITQFCQLMSAAEDAKYYSTKFDEMKDYSRSMASNFRDAAKNNEINGERLGPAADPEKKGGGLLSGMDFKDWLGLGMLGVMGATAYCGATGKCMSKPAASGNDISGMGNNGNMGTGAATAPTPESRNNGITGTGNNNGNLGSVGANNSNGKLDTGASKPVINTTKAPLTASVPGGGESSEKENGANVAFDRNLASTGGGSSGSAGGFGGAGMAGAGGGSLGTASNGSSGASSSDPAAKPSADNTYSSTGGSSPGTFSLGGSSSTDAALKNILNGDTPPAGLDGLGTTPGADAAALLDPAAALGAVQAAPTPGEGIGSDSESVFLRVRESHVRCLKRGCVTFGIGKNP